MAIESTQQHAQEIAAGERSSLGANWTRFLELLNDKRIAVDKESLRTMLRVKDLTGKTFLDASCGSGLFRLAARRLGAQVHSFDYDPQSLACTSELRQRYFTGDPTWRVERASVLDTAYLSRRGQSDVVYSWGGVHHTGKMWDALANVAPMVAVKKAYCKRPGPLKFLVLWPAFVFLWWQRIVKDFLLPRLFASWRDYTKLRGMSPWRDVVDWVGGYPFEVAKPQQLVHFYRDRGFVLTELRTKGRNLGCNELVFIKSTGQPAGNPE